MKQEPQDIDIMLSTENIVLSINPEGYWFGNEVFGLMDFMEKRTWKNGADLGCGDGIIAILLGNRYPDLNIWAIDINPLHCKRTEKNVARNNLSGQITVHNQNIRLIQKILKKGCCDLITANPPFFPVDGDHQNLNPDETVSRQETSGNLKMFLFAADYLCARNGDLYIIYHPSRLDILFNELSHTQFTCKHLQILYHVDGRALFVLCHCIKGAGKGMIIKPPGTLKHSIKHQFRK